MTELNYTPVKNRLRVCHFPQIPCKPFIVEVNNEREAYLIEQVFANQHLWLFENKMISDYCNAIIVEIWDEEEDTCSYVYGEKTFDSLLSFKNFLKKLPELKGQDLEQIIFNNTVHSKGTWVDYWNETEEMDWDEFVQTYFKR